MAFTAEGLAGDPRARRRRTIPTQQLSPVATGEATTAYGYSFILTDMPGPPSVSSTTTATRAQIEERIKDHTLGVSLKHLAASDLFANRTWLPAGRRWADASARAYARGLSPPAWARAAAITMRGAHRGAAIPKDGRDRARDRLSVRDRADSGGPNPLEAPQPTSPTSPTSNARSAPIHESRSERV